MDMRPLHIIIAVLTAQLSFAQPNADLRVHDPVMIKQGDTYYLFCTGRGISVYSSIDMKSWKEEPRVFLRSPE